MFMSCSMPLNLGAHNYFGNSDLIIKTTSYFKASWIKRKSVSEYWHTDGLLKQYVKELGVLRLLIV